jgi:formate hydrogenlyase subunit 3/multisubunit Na+/H+ antiporter MnhD subunit
MDSLLLPVALPAIAGLLALLVPDRVRALRTVLGVLGALGAFVAGTAIVDLAGQTATLGALTFGELELDLALSVDVFSSWAVAFVGLLGLATALYAVGWFRGRSGAPGRYFAWLLLAVAGANGVLLADNLLLLVVSWEIVTLMLFLLVITGREDGAEGAAKAFTMLGLGDLALIVGVILVGVSNLQAGHADAWSLATLRAQPLVGTGAANVVAWLLLFVAAAAKAGAMPFHSWIPTLSTGAHPSVMAFLPGSLDKVLGIFLLARISLEWFTPSPALRMVVMIVGACTILGAVFMAMLQHDLRRLLSFHAVSQVGYMLLGIGTGTVIGVMGGVFHMVNHAIYKACLFLGAGSVERETGTQDLGRLGGLGKTMPVTFACMFVAALAISGIPPMNGFVSKWLVYQACVAVDQPIFLIAALFGSVLTLASFVKVLHSVFWGPRPSALDGAAEGSGGIGMPIAMVTLAALCILLGVFAAFPLDTWIGPVAGLDAAGPVTGSAALDGAPATLAAVGATEAPATPYPTAVFAPLGITMLLLIGVVVGLLVAFTGQMRARRVRGVFVGGQVFNRDENRFPGTEFYKTVAELPGLGKALEVGERGTLDLYRLGGRSGGPPIRLLRRLHSGLATTYVVWCLVGLAVLFATLMLGRV